MDWDQIVKYFTEHKDDAEVKEFIAKLQGEHKVTKEEFESFLGTDEGKSVVQPMIDQRVTQALTTNDKKWNDKNKELIESEVKKKVAEEILKINPAEEPWQREIRELKEQNAKDKAERDRADLKRMVVEEAARMKIEPFFIEDFLPSTIEEGKLYLKKIDGFLKKYKDDVVNEVMVSGSERLKSGKDKEGKIDLSKLTQEEIIRMEMDGTLDDEITG